MPSTANAPWLKPYVDEVTSFPMATSNDDQVQFYSVVVYGGAKQLDAFGTLKNSQIGNRQIKQNTDGSATIVLYPNGATDDQVTKIAAVASAVLASGSRFPSFFSSTMPAIWK